MPLYVSKRLDNAWKYKGVDKKAVAVAYRCIDRFLGTFVPEPQAKKLEGRGLLITRDDMLALV
jgi:hypothetical protein